MKANAQQVIFCRPHLVQVSSDVSFAALSEVIADKTLPAILGGNASVEGQSIFTAEPVEVFEFSLDENQPFEKLLSVLSKYQQKKEKVSDPFYFLGGWIGYFGYELGRFVEKLPEKAVDDLGYPVIRLAFYDKAILFDHSSRQFTLMALAYEGQKYTRQQKFQQLRHWLDEAQNMPVPALENADIEKTDINAIGRNMTKAVYLNAISRIKHYIVEGDTYQINLSQRFETPFTGRPIDVFHWQNCFNPSPFSAYLAWDDKAVVSASPELFLRADGDSIVTKPIKGTRPRNPLLPDDASENESQFHDLVLSEKDQAELAMIVDLERNDLAKICVPGTRRTTRLREIEIFPTVYHAVAVVEGQLSGTPSAQRIIDILRAAFPGGSITGAPKIRSMEIIDELEPTARGVYTGSIGWIGLNYDLCWNIAIRTILIAGQRSTIQAGGGIVADSDAEVEWQETITKARALLAGIQAVQKYAL